MGAVIEMAPTVGGERYEVAKARLDLAEAIAECDAAGTPADRAMAQQRVEDARCRLSRWLRSTGDRAS